MKGFDAKFRDFPDYILGITKEIWEDRGIHTLHDYYAEDIVEPAFTLNDDSTLSVPAGPGIGVAVNAERLAAVTRRTAEFTAS